MCRGAGAGCGRWNGENQRASGARRGGGGISSFPADVITGHKRLRRVAHQKGSCPVVRTVATVAKRTQNEVSPRSPINDVVDRGRLEVVSAHHPTDRIGR